MSISALKTYSSAFGEEKPQKVVLQKPQSISFRLIDSKGAVASCV